jgi:hypothetical protein
MNDRLLEFVVCIAIPPWNNCLLFIFMKWDSRSGLSENVSDHIINLAAAESPPVVDRHGIPCFPLD